jgi:chromosome partitioning protein
MNIAGVLTEKGKRTLMIDLDQQCNLSNTLLLDSIENRKSVFDLFIDDSIDIQEVISETEFPLLNIIPSSHLMAGIDKRMADEYNAQYILREKLEIVKGNYDFIIIDCPPSLGLATISALICANYVIIPMTMDQWAVNGSNKLSQLVLKIRKRANPELEILGYIINKFDTRRNLEKAYFEFVNSDNNKVFKTIVKVSVKYPEAVLTKKPINYFLPVSEQAETFRNLVLEIIERCQKKDLSRKSEITTKQYL